MPISEIQSPPRRCRPVRRLEPTSPMARMFTRFFPAGRKDGPAAEEVSARISFQSSRAVFTARRPPRSINPASSSVSAGSGTPPSCSAAFSSSAELSHAALSSFCSRSFRSFTRKESRQLPGFREKRKVSRSASFTSSIPGRGRASTHIFARRSSCPSRIKQISFPIL